MILIKMNLLCDFNCKYCYQNKLRALKGPLTQEYDIDKVEEAVRKLYNKTKGQIVLHGGEPLILPKHIIERLLKLSFDLSGRSSIQTNGYNIDDDIIQLFKKYKTSVGISIDGPYPCNELRGRGNEEERKKQTDRILEKIDRLKAEGISTSVIVVMHKKNSLGERREILKSWILSLWKKKINGRLNPCYTNDPEIDLTEDEGIEAYSDLLDFMVKNGISGWSPFKDIKNSLLGEQNVVCVFRECDPYATQAATSVLNDGSLGVCVRQYWDGIYYLRDRNRDRNYRSEVLKQTDCKNCEWWNYCHGGCPGMAIDSDWRRKDKFCEVYKVLFKKISNIIKFIGKQRIEKKKTRYPIGRDMGGQGHTDGIEHIDGNTRHLDSGPRHSDGIEHIDGNLRHLDSR